MDKARFRVLLQTTRMGVRATLTAPEPSWALENTRYGLILSFAEEAHFVQQFFGGKVVTQHRAIIPDIHHVKGMQPILIVDIYAVTAVF